MSTFSTTFIQRLMLETFDESHHDTVRAVLAELEATEVRRTLESTLADSVSAMPTGIALALVPAASEPMIFESVFDVQDFNMRPLDPLEPLI